jgi:hypothetical protein
MAVLEGKHKEAIQIMEKADTTRDPEIQVYFARHHSRMNLTDLAFKTLERVAKSGFVLCAAEYAKFRRVARSRKKTFGVFLAVEHCRNSG